MPTVTKSPVSVMCPEPENTVVPFPAGRRTGVSKPRADRGLVLDKQTVKKLACPAGKAEQLWRDSKLTGFILRCYANGKRVWLVQYRDEGGATRRVNIGDANVVDAGDARRKAEQLLSGVKLGQDPSANRRDVRSAVKFGDEIEGYLAWTGDRTKPSTLRETRRNLTVNCRTLHATAAMAVTRQDVAELHGKLTTGKGRATANRTLASISSFYAWLIGRGLAEANPASFVPKNAEVKRDRVLTDDELRAVWKATESGASFDRIVRLLLLTGTRRSEAGDMEWSELTNGSGWLWTIPAARSKNALPHEVPLSTPAYACLPAMQGEKPHVFGRTKSAGFSGWSKAKSELDRAVGFDDWSLHDIRRTASTRMHDLGVAPHIVEAILNHISGHKAGVGGTYNKASYREQKRDALELWAATIERITGENPSANRPKNI